jgi:3-dehydroshikimate dehydratase
MSFGRPGLLSVTFRQLSPEDIVRLAQANGLSVLEWGGDVHVPPGDTARAREVSALSRRSGLEVICYGSYYRAGHEGCDGVPVFRDVLASAEALGAPSIRVWAGRQGSDTADDDYFARVCDDAARIAEVAEGSGIKVVFEFHGKTLTDTPASARRLYEALPQANIGALWQPLPSLDRAAQDESLDVVLPRLAHVHVYHWLPGPPVQRRPLAEGRSAWLAWLTRMAEAERQPDCLLEFLQDDRVDHLPDDADALRSWLTSAADAIESAS